MESGVQRCWVVAVAVMSTAVVCSGCVIHTESQDAPCIDGVITHEGKPLAGVTVRRVFGMEEKQDCTGTTAEAVKTDEQGRFRFPRVSHTGWVLLPGDPVDSWRVCFDSGHGDLGWWEGGGIASPERTELVCRSAGGSHEHYGGGKGEGVDCVSSDEARFKTAR